MSEEKRLMHQPRKGTPVENIIAHFLDERDVVLTEEEERLKECYRTAFMLMVEEDSILTPVTKIMELFNCNRSTAYNYMNNAQLVFGQAQKLDKEAMRIIQIERKRQLIKKAKDENNLEVAARLERDIDKLMDFDKDPEKFNPEKFKAIQIELKVPKGTRELLERMYAKGVVDFNNVETTDISHEEVD